MGLPGGISSKESAYNARDAEEVSSIPESERFPWRRDWQPTPVFLPGESHGQRSLAATVHTVTKSWTPLKWLSIDACINDIELKSRSRVSLSYFLWNPDYNLQRNMRCYGFFVLLSLFWGTGVYIVIHTVKIDFISITWTERILH